MSRALLLLVAAMALAGQTGPADVDPRLVHLHATVTDAKGVVIRGLAADEFEVTEAGAPLGVEQVRFIAAPPDDPAEPASPILTREDEAREASHEGTRLVAIYLDEYHVTAGATADRAREAAQALLKQLAPRDLVVVVKPLDSLMNIRLTRDRGRAAAALASFEGRRGLYAPRTLFEKAFIAADPDRVEGARAQIATAAIGALIEHLDVVGDGRKALVVLSEGFGRGPRRRDGLPTLSGLVRAASRGGVSVYPIDPRALMPASAPAASDQNGDPASLEALQSLAEGSGGAALLRPAPLSPFITRIVGDLTNYYQLTVRAPTSGSGFHPVQVRSRRAGAVVRGASGYFGPTAAEIARAERLARELAGVEAALDTPAPAPVLPDRPLVGSTGLIQSWFGQSPGPDGQTSVHFVWEPSSSAAVPTRGEPVNVAVKAAMEDGSVVFEGVVARTDVTPEGSHSIAFSAPPGRLRVLLAIVDADSELMGVELRDVRVRPSDGPLWLGTPALLRGRTEEELQARAADPSAAPAASREFSSTDRVLLRVSAQADPAAPEVTATIVSRLLRMGWVLPVTPGPTPGHYDIAIPLADLGNGEHDIQVMAEGPAGRATETVTIRVTR